MVPKGRPVVAWPIYIDGSHLYTQISGEQVIPNVVRASPTVTKIDGTLVVSQAKSPRSSISIDAYKVPTKEH